MPAKIAVITYSLYGHINSLAAEVVKGARGTGASVDHYQLPETLSEDVLTKMYAPPKADIPVLEDPAILKEYDGFIFGIPTRYGRAPAQFDTFFDKTGGLWATGALVGKFAAIFTSTAGQHGGQETTIFTTLPWLTHHGIAYVPLGYQDQAINKIDEIVGGSPWGAATISNSDGSRQPSAAELGVAQNQGKYFATFVNQFVSGKEVLAVAETKGEDAHEDVKGDEKKELLEPAAAGVKKTKKSRVWFCCGSNEHYDS